VPHARHGHQIVPPELAPFALYAAFGEDRQVHRMRAVGPNIFG